MALDHSIVVHGGMFVMFSLRIDSDRPDYSRLAEETRNYLDAVLGGLGLSLGRPGPK